MYIDNGLRWYICGPMSGIPQFNIPRFDEVARILRRRGLQIVSPSELDSPGFRTACLASKDGKLPESGTWAQLLGRDIELIADKVGGIVLLPGWQNSRGARLEVFVGLLTEKQFAVYDDATEEAYPQSTEVVRIVLQGHMP